MLLITGDDSHFVGTDMTVGVRARAACAPMSRRSSPRSTTPAATPSTAPARGASLASILDDQVLSKAVSTVDDLDLVQGRIGAVLALEVVGSGDSRSLRLRPDATTPLPPHPS